MQKRKTVVKSLRLHPDEMAWAMEAADRLGVEYGGTPTGAIKIMIYTGMNSILGSNWTTEDPPEKQVERAVQTKQAIDPTKLNPHKQSQETSSPSRFAEISPVIIDSDYQQVWNMIKNEYLTPMDQLSSSPKVA